MSADPHQRRNRLWALVMRREIAVRLRDTVFIVSTMSIIAMMSLGFVAQFAMGSSQDGVDKVATVGNSAAKVVAAAGEPADGVDDSLSSLLSQDDVHAVPRSSEDAARGAVQDGEVRVALMRESHAWKIIVDDQCAATGLISQLASAVAAYQLQENLARANISVGDLYAGSNVEITDTSGVEHSDERQFNTIVGILLTLVFATVIYVTLVLFGTAIAGSVVTEKESRIVDILSAAVPLRQILLGKVTGTSVLAAGQLVIISTVAIIGVRFIDFPVELLRLDVALLWYVPFLVAGFLVMAFLFAAAGAMASRTEDVQATQMPLTMVAMVAFFVPVLIAMRDVDYTIPSYTPLLSTTFMPVRMFLGEARWWEPIASLLLTALAGYLM